MAAEPREYRGDLEVLDVAGERDAARRSDEADVDELLDVEGSVEVGRFRDWRGDLDSRGVDGLPAVVAIDATRDFANEDRGESLASDFLVDAEEIHLRVRERRAEMYIHHVDGLAADAHRLGSGGDEAVEMAVVRTAHSDMVILDVARRC